MSKAMKILLATDGSETAHAATDFLMGMPLPEGSAVTVMTVLKRLLREDEVAALEAPQRRAYQETRETALAEAQALLDTEAQRLRSAGLATDTLICEGSAAEEIVRQTGEGGYNLVTVGSHGTHGARDFLLGRVSDRVFEYAPCSVLIVKPASDQAVSDQHLRLLLAYDDSPPARAAVELCAALPLPANSKLRAITVLPQIRMFRQDVHQQLSWVWQEKREKAQMALQWVSGEIEWKNIEVSTEVIESEEVAKAILDQARDFDSDLLVIGNKSKHAFERFLLGSVTAKVAHHAPCSVLSVRVCD